VKLPQRYRPSGRFYTLKKHNRINTNKVGDCDV
jgi:hypothetical protein